MAFAGESSLSETLRLMVTKPTTLHNSQVSSHEPPTGSTFPNPPETKTISRNIWTAKKVSPKKGLLRPNGGKNLEWDTKDWLV